MKLMFKIFTVIILFCQCKAKDTIDLNVTNNKPIVKENRISVKADTIYGYKNDTITVDLQVEFSKGKFWHYKDSKQHVLFIKEDEIQRYENQEIKDYQRFQFFTKDTGNTHLVFQLKSPFGNDTTMCETQSKYLIIKPKT